MRVLIACEFSGVVRDAFRERGHEAFSCDILPAEDGGPHIQGDAWQTANFGRWDMMIAHPPCRLLNHAGVRWLYKDGKRWLKDKEGNVVENPRNEPRWEEMRESVKFFLSLLNAPVEKVAVENSQMHPHALELVGVKPTQSIQPWQFGHGEVKETCLWLRGLPNLQPTEIVSGRTPRVHFASPGPDRWKERSRTLKGIAQAMAEQWGRSCL